ncbi:glycosyltransferase family 2 protein [Methylocella silvestris]|uniref:Glycosyl transferase n=1 Tax=Methylocella silvestris TaxID=199596 RepID=A0A2J7TGU4_METSI|nr:glycosyltransferase family 2 protein [Methylocella silvestris]PNG25977.1 glycosyl transferase [Methylocella silvestris]
MNEVRVTERFRYELQGAEADSRAPALSLPLVSVIVVNYNYGRFLAAAVGSVFDQTYPNVECVIVDNASTDETPEVLRAIEARHPQAKIIRRAANDGQTPAALDGLKASRGPYVIFLDADDLLLPHCVETHVYVHLSLRVHVGFSSGDLLQAAGNEVVLGAEEAFNRVITAKRGVKTNYVRPYRQPAGGPFATAWPGENFDRSILKRLRFVAPMTNEWVWSPTSGNCFRRDALDLFCDNAEIATLRTGTDLYFCLGVNAISGSVLIDDALAVYRLHGGNIFSKRPQLHNVLSYQPGGSGDSNAWAKAILIDHLIDRAAFFLERGWTSFDYALLLRRLDCSNPDAGPATPRWSARSRVATRLVESYKDVAAVLGMPIARGLMFVSGVPWAAIIWPPAPRSRG